HDAALERPSFPTRRSSDLPERWFNGGEAFDAECRERYLMLHMAAARAELSGWSSSPEGALALILLLDQIPRNVFRGSSHAYATEDRKSTCLNSSHVQISYA